MHIYESDVTCERLRKFPIVSVNESSLTNRVKINHLCRDERSLDMVSFNVYLYL